MAVISRGDVAKINDVNAYCHSPRIANPSKDLIYIIWHESKGIYGRKLEGTPERASIMYRVSHNGGQSFGKINKLYDFEGHMSASPAVTASPKSKRVFMCWSDTDESKNSHYKTKVLFAKTEGSDVGSDKFEVPVYLDAQNQRGNRLANYEQGSVIGDALTLAPSGSRTSFSRHGITAAPWLLAIGDNVYVMWVGLTDLLAGQANVGYRTHVDCRVRFAASSDAGNSFSEIIDLGSYTIRDQAVSANFRLRALDNRVYALWYQFGSAGSGSMVVRKSRDGRKSFDPTVALDGMRYQGQPESTQMRLGDIAVINDTKITGGELLATYIVTEQPRNRGMMDFMPFQIGSSTAYLVKGSIDENNSLSFKDPVKVVEDSAGGTDVPLTMCENFVHVIWTRNFGEGLDLRSSSDYGKSFEPKVSIKLPRDRTGQWNGGRYPIIACQGESVFVAWHHHGNNTSASGTGERPKMRPSVLYLSASPDGKSFLDPILISENELARSGQPIFIVDGRTIYFAWGEGNEQGSDILFRKLMINIYSYFHCQPPCQNPMH
jgi:hypothetical protein